jgi:tetratricopeptide (TPR) repeat protein
VAADGSQLWSTVYDRRSVADLPAIADDVAVAVGLQFRPEGEAGAPLRLSRSGRPRAYAAYVEGRSLLRRWLYRYSPEAEEAVGRARSRLEEALEVDPGFAPPYVELARLHLWRDGVEESESRAREYLERALALDPQMEDAHVLWASLELFWDVDLDGARRAIERALELNPAHAEALEVRATLLVVGGRHDEAVAAVRRYRALAPLSVITAAQAAWHFYFAGRLEEARQAGEDGLALDPRCVGCLRALVLICRQSGELAEATEWARREMALREAGPALASLAATAADPEEALAVYWRWRLDTAPERSSPTVRAEVQMALGNPEAALDLLERAARDREDWRRLYLADDPSFAPLRRDPRFEEVLADLFSARLVVKINRSATIATSR